MNVKKQLPFVVDGVKSWLFCDRRIKEKNDKTLEYYYHYHDYIELLYAIDADCEIWSNGKCYSFVTGDFAVLNSNEPHYVLANRKSEYVCVLFSPEILYADENAFLEYKYVAPFVSNNSLKTVFKEGEIADAKKLSVEIMEAWENEEYAHELIIRANILKLFAGVLKNLKKEDIYTSASHIGPEIKKALIYITEHFDAADEKTTAEACNLSYYHFSRTFKKTMGQTFNQYLLNVKINQAEKYLISSDKSVTEIAFITGFSSASHFISKFKEKNNVTPYKYREIAKKPQNQKRI